MPPPSPIGANSNIKDSHPALPACQALSLSQDKTHIPRKNCVLQVHDTSGIVQQQSTTQEESTVEGTSSHHLVFSPSHIDNLSLIPSTHDLDPKGLSHPHEMDLKAQCHPFLNPQIDDPSPAFPSGFGLPDINVNQTHLPKPKPQPDPIPFSIPFH